jgi:hypothetical protein
MQDDGKIMAVGRAVPKSSGARDYFPAFLIARFEGDSNPDIAVTPTTGLVTTEAGGSASFTVVLTTQPTADVTIPVSSSNTAEGTVSTDFLTFTPDNWDVPQTVTVTGVDDDDIDGDVAYTIVLGPADSADPAYHGLDPAYVSVINRDDEIGLSIDNVTATEGNSGSKIFYFTVTRSGDLSQAITVDFATEDGTANAGSDYEATSGTLYFAPGEQTKTIAVTVYGDKLVEEDETFFIRLLNASVGVILLNDEGVGTILNDDSKPGGGKK